MRLIKRAGDFRGAEEPPIAFGNYVMLNSGGPIMIVVDLTTSDVTCAWVDNEGCVWERVFPEPCVHRFDPLRRAA